MVWKKLVFCVMICTVLSACAAKSAPTQSGLDLRTSLLEAGGCSFQAVIGADLGDRVYRFTVNCRYTAGGQTELTVLQPEELSGISATVAQDGVSVTFDSAELDFGPMANELVSPITACQVLGRCWTGGYLESGGTDGALERITCLDGYEEQELKVDTWLENGLPVYAEITFDNTRCLTLQLSDFRFEGNQ